MKKRHILSTVALALSIVGLSALPAKALTYNTDDLFIGFYASAGNATGESLLVNIGQASTYRDFTGDTTTLSIGNIGADLTSIFGSWTSRSDVRWGVFGASYTGVTGSDPQYTMYASKPQGTLGTQAQAYNNGSSATLSGPASRLNTLGTTWASQFSATGNSTVSAHQDSTTANTFAKFQGTNGTPSFSFFNGALGNFGSGTAGTALDLFRLTVGSSQSKSTYEGSFFINDSGAVTFSSTVTPVPEPATYGLAMAVAALAFVVIRRRRMAANS